jgi:hypothetical protein
MGRSPTRVKEGAIIGGVACYLLFSGMRNSPNVSSRFSICACFDYPNIVGRGEAIGKECSFYPRILSRLPRPYGLLN